MRGVSARASVRLPWHGRVARMACRLWLRLQPARSTCGLQRGIREHDVRATRSGRKSRGRAWRSAGQGARTATQPAKAQATNQAMGFTRVLTHWRPSTDSRCMPTGTCMGER